MKFGCVTLDSKNAEEHADFYQKLLGWPIRFTNTDDSLKFVGITNETQDLILLFQEEENYERPVWPTEKGQQQQMTHLDFFTDDLEKDVAHAIACGAAPAQTQFSDRWRVMIDPAGHPFCIEKMT
jgi:catechol 2,3-dioxygenase-like lactoylglutathione lyase family enzyme